MFKKAVVGVDRSPAESPLLSCLPDLLRWAVNAVVLVHVIRVGYVEGAEYGHEDECQDWLKKCAEPLHRAGLGVEVSIRNSINVAAELLQLAHQHSADLIVVCSRSHNFLHDLFIGSVAREVLEKSEIPVLIERIEPTPTGTAERCVAVCRQKLDRVLLATDLSDQSSAAEDAAVALAPGAERIDCLTVLPITTAGVNTRDESVLPDKLRKIVHRIEEAGGQGSARIEYGDHSEVIARIGQEGYTLIIVGKHGHGWVPGNVIGSTAAKVCEIARRPVLMVPGAIPGRRPD